MTLFAALELLSWFTLTEQKVRGLAMLVIGMFAFRAYLHHRREMLDAAEHDKSSEGELGRE